MMEIKYWNRRKGEKSVKKTWDTVWGFITWIEKLPPQTMHKGRFTVKINRGYGKDPLNGITTVIDWEGRNKEEIKGMVEAVVFLKSKEDEREGYEILSDVLDKEGGIRGSTTHD